MFILNISDRDIHEGDTKRFVVSPLSSDGETAATLATLAAVFIRPDNSEVTYDETDLLTDEGEQVLFHTFDVPGTWKADFYGVGLNGHGERTIKETIEVEAKLRSSS